uniref:ATP synthase complex subunit 8 n=1 Tax=Mekongiella kingdoni TaxID=244710 RepID=X2BUX1_9ORTH|nr:ATP synthase F0 subunit 8 [Mekongiella kingdoni]ADZ56303.1 ATP synthase F0 subunit 8 [Mekongiella kingdoni]
MPQMSPMMWFTMFILFSTTMVLFNQMMFFSSKMNKISLNKKEMNQNYHLNWKW